MVCNALRISGGRINPVRSPDDCFPSLDGRETLFIAPLKVWFRLLPGAFRNCGNSVHQSDRRLPENELDADGHDGHSENAPSRSTALLLLLARHRPRPTAHANSCRSKTDSRRHLERLQRKISAYPDTRKRCVTLQQKRSGRFTWNTAFSNRITQDSPLNDEETIKEPACAMILPTHTGPMEFDTPLAYPLHTSIRITINATFSVVLFGKSFSLRSVLRDNDNHLDTVSSTVKI